jgi:hypothetical protein
MIRGVTQVRLANGRKPLPKTEKALRVLVVYDDRDGADSIGRLVEELGNQPHVTFQGTRLVLPRCHLLRAFESR